MKMYFKCLVSVLVALLFAVNVYAIEWEQSDEVEKIFEDAGVEGAFVLYDPTRDVYVGHNQVRAEERFIPASTFKIPNSLIGLSVGAIASVDEVLPYGGEPQFLKIWEQDMSLREAIVISNVPIYQELARRIGLERMRESVASLNYGNTQIGDHVDSFWLKGPLEISAIEQVEFLNKLASGLLPFPVKAKAKVAEITLLESNDRWQLHGKTGMYRDPNPDVAWLGWWVGWVAKGENIYPFALNMELQDFNDNAKRISLGKSALQALGIL